MTQDDLNTPIAESQSNTLGLVGFIVSIVGLITGGCLAPIGLVLSIIAVFKQPRGFAIAGIVISLVGLLLFVVILLPIIGLILLAGVAIAAVTEAIDDFTGPLNNYYDTNGAYPATLDEVGIDLSVLDEAYGGGWQYNRAPDGQSFTIVGPGPDGQLDTEDDFTIAVDRTRYTGTVGGQQVFDVNFGGGDGAESSAPQTPDTPAPDAEPDAG
ncbi:MAG: DUF4190 domain-containing protein [Planctomycetota bacterium]